MTFWRLLWVFLWKNFLYVRFNYISLLIIFVGCSSILTLYLKTTYTLLTTPEVVYDSKNTELLKQYFPANDEDYLFYAPATSFLDGLMENVRQELQLSGNAVKSFNNAAIMRAYIEQNCRGNCFAIDFVNGTSEKPMSLHFSISSTAIRVSPKKRYVNDEEVSGIKDDDDYIRTGFLTLQHIIDKNFIKMHDGIDYDLEISSIPSIAQESIDSQRLILFGSIYSILFSVLLLSTFLVPLVEEKQTGLKEFLVIATPLNFLNGATFFFIRLILYVIFMVVGLITASTDQTLGVTPIVPIILLFLLYMLSAMSYAYLISVCFNTVFSGKVGGLLLLTVPFIFYLVKGSISYTSTFCFSTKAFMDAIEILQIFTNKHRNFSWSDITVNITENSFSILSIYIILIMQCLVYSLLYNYLANVFPGPGGLKKPYTFFLMRSFYKKKQRNQYTTSERGTDAIIIQDLVKKFHTPTRQITIADHLNMIIKDKQITALLGHNGAGKTTTLNMIMGSEPKDSGKIIVCCERDVASYRHLIGFCPQHSVFMNYMTCKQHLQFFARLRGISRKGAQELADCLLDQLKLVDKAHVYGRQLSGGMKRKLSLGIALSGDTKVIILDEPSSGLDVESRRELWDILLKLRKTKAVLITTHHMEEAEVLGDTICILASGRLQRTGSPLELKRKAGSGYILKLSTNQFREQTTLNLIKEYIPTAKILNIVPPTVQISLPYNTKENYSDMLLKLESYQNELGINAISITDTSLEDVFLNCATEMDQVDTPISVGLQETRVPYQRLDEPSHTLCQQFKAVWYKKLIYLRREWHFTLLMFLIPLLSILLAICLMHSTSIIRGEDILALKLNHIKEGTIYIHNAADSDGSAKRIEDIIRQQIEQDNIEVKTLNLNDSQTVTWASIELQKQDLAHFLQNVIGVIEIKSDNNGNLQFSLHYSGNIYHSSVIMTNIIDNAMLKLQTDDRNSIETSYLPIRRFITDVSPTRLEYYAVIVPIGLFFYIFLYIALPFQENDSGFKSIQPIPRTVYWICVISFDMVLHCVVCMFLYAVQIFIIPQELYSMDEQLLIAISICFYGWSYLPILYCFANSCRSVSTISTYLLFMLVVSAIVPLITSGNIQAMKYHDTEILFLSVILPDFNLNHQLRIINENFIILRRNNFSTVNTLDCSTFFINSVILFCMVLSFFIFILENKYKRQGLTKLFSCYNCGQVSVKQSRGPEEEEGLVKQEKTAVDTILRDETDANYPLLVSNLYKFYNQKPAVCGLNFAVKRQECFGLLGVNGAGKTSTFQMITTNLPITGGTIRIDGYDIITNESAYLYRFGYCPQSDCLNNFMTAYETLKFMAQLRGLECTHIHSEVMYWLEKLDLVKYKDVQIRHYSGGTKRKLNAALAMICSPSLVLLDEPTTGVDPVSRRFLWQCIQEFQRRDKTIVLTSHSMDECEQLCNRLAIMVDGVFRCLGNIPDLKKRYSSGFTVKVKMNIESCRQNIEKITEKFRLQFEDCELRENHAGMLTYFVQNSDHIAWSNVFRKTEQFFSDCEELVEDYSLNESTLEDIFLKFDTKNRTVECSDMT